MKKALSCKFILLLIAFALSVALAFTFYGVKPVHADISADNISTYFSGAESFALENGNLNATINKTDNKVSITKKLVVDDLALEMNVPENVSSFTITLTYDSYFVNGALDETDNEFDKTIKNAFTFTAKGNLTVYFTTEDNILSVKVGNSAQTKNDNYYKIKGADKCSAKISFEFTLTESADSANVVLKSIDQKASDESGAYKQTFILNEENNIAVFALPRVSVDDMPMVNGGGTLKAIVGTKYSLTFTVYSVFGNVAASDVYISASDNFWADPSTDKPKSIIFETEGEAEFSIRTDDAENIESYIVNSTNRDSDENQAPQYIDYETNAEIYGWYNELVKTAAEKTYDVDDKKITRSIRLGDTYEIPSLEDLVYDDYDLYSSLKYTVYYKTPSNSSSTSSLSFTVSEVGDYEFYVVFKDVSGKAMEQDDFYTVDENNDQIRTFGIYGHAVFTFTIEDNAPISVEVPESQGKGYLNTTYVATEFKILSGANETFTLYYNPDKNATENSDGWVEMPNLSDINEDYNENGFTYSDIKALAYDGKYTFTPVKVGAYKIKCYVSSGNAVRYAEGETVISISEKPAEVKVPSTWLKDNVWSVVFLSIGTLALIGIVVLLFIKPKEETETDETGDALKVNAKK